LVKEGNLIYDAYYQQMVVSGPDYGACNFGGSAKIVSDCLALPGLGHSIIPYLEYGYGWQIE